MSEALLARLYVIACFQATTPGFISSMGLDNTYSISEAVLALEKRQRRQRQSPASTGPADDGPVDVVAVVSGVATLNSTLASSSVVSNITPRVDLRIIDPSIPSSNVVAKVTLQGSMDVARIADEQISPGDIIRFNRLRLGRHHHPQDSHDNNNDHDQERGGGAGGSNNTLLHFEVSLDDPEPGFRWFKLGRIRIMSSGPDDDADYGFGDRSNHVHVVFSGGGTDNHRSRRAILSDDRRGARNFPQEMVTSDSRIGELLDWYAKRGLTGHGSTPATSSVRGSSAAVASLEQERSQRPSPLTTTFGVDHNVRSLSPLPCKRRSLAEIQASSGLLSNLVVRITHYDSQVIPLQSSATTSSVSGVSPKHVRQRQVIGFASVTDSSGVVMSFVDPGDRYGSFLRAGAEDPRKIIMMTNVMSKKQSEIFGRPLVSEEVVLWPTKQTSVSMLDQASSDERSDGFTDDPRMARGIGGDDRDRRRALPESWSGATAAFSDRSTRTRRARGDEGNAAVMLGREDVETQHQQTQDINALDHDLISMESSIDDIFLDGLSLRQCLMDWSPVDLQGNMVTSDGQEYRSVMIQLASKSGRRNTTSHDNLSLSSSSVLLHVAGSSVVQALCGGIPPTEWKVDTPRGEQDQTLDHDNDDERGTSSVADKNDHLGGGLRTSVTSTSDECPTSLGWNVLRLLRALLFEDVALTWRIDVHHDPPRVDCVFLSSF